MNRNEYIAEQKRLHKLFEDYIQGKIAPDAWICRRIKGNQPIPDYNNHILELKDVVKITVADMSDKIRATAKWENDIGIFVFPMKSESLEEAKQEAIQLCLEEHQDKNILASCKTE